MRQLSRWCALALVTLAATFFAGAAPALAATAIVIDADSGKVLYALDPDEGHYPASLVKMMTLYLTFEAVDKGRLRLDQPLPVSASAAGRIPSKLYLARGDSITVEDAILALVTKSANDAASVLAEALGGTESAFARIMTAKGRSLGMGRTTFQNASGLYHRFQYTTARDMARLAQALLEHYPQYYGYFSTPRFTYRGVTYTNHNNLLGRYEGVDGIKTGYLSASGYNLAASVVRDGHRLIGVLLGGTSPSSRDATMAQLFDVAFTRIAVNEYPGGRESPALGLAAAGGLQQGGLAVPRAPLAPAPPVGSLPGDAQWAAQVGAYRDYAGARARLSEAAQVLPLAYREGAEVLLPAVDAVDPLYRVRIGGLTEVQARDACRRLEPRRVPCLVVDPADEPPGLAAATLDGHLPLVELLRLLGPAQDLSGAQP